MNPTDGLSRRRLLSLGAAAGGLAAAGTLLPPSLHAAMAAPMPRGGLRAIEHVIVLMQENRSFDHYFGTLHGVRGFGDGHPLRLPSGRPVFRQPAPGGGEVLPFSVRGAAARVNRPGTDIEYIDDLPHGFTDATAAWRQGWYDGWIPAKTPATMTHYERADIPLQYELAESFTVCDAYFCSVFGSTNPNRNYLWSGTTGFELGTNRRAVTNAAYSYDHPGYDWTTYPERLEAAGVSWQIYQEWDNFTDNAVEYFLPFKAIGRTLLAAVDGRYRTTEELYYAVLEMPADEQRRLLGQLAAARARLSPAQRSLFDRGMARSEPESLVPRLRADIAARRLPAVSWLVPSAVDSEHPGASTPVGSANLIYDVLDAIASDLDTWSRTTLFVNFDENDGFFDHVPPPVAPRPVSGNDDDWFDGRPIGLGPRVPMTVVSPWTIGGFVSSEVFDHTSTIRFLERWTGVAEPQISEWRRAVCGDLTSTFDFRNPGVPPRLARPGPIPAPIERWRPAPPADQAQPEQEPGTRPARAVPYRPAVSTVLRGPATLRLTLENTGPAAAPFAVYPYAGELPEPAHRPVRGRQTLDLPLLAGRYDLAVQGPDGFWAELAGSVTGARVDVQAHPGPGGSLSLVLRNAGATAVTVMVAAVGAGPASATVELAPGRTRRMRWATADGRYDLQVTAAHDPAYRRRLTGRVDAPGRL